MFDTFSCICFGSSTLWAAIIIPRARPHFMGAIMTRALLSGSQPVLFSILLIHAGFGDGFGYIFFCLYFIYRYFSNRLIFPRAKSMFAIA